MSKIAKRNYVKKNMDKMHRPSKHMSDKTYNRKRNALKLNTQYYVTSDGEVVEEKTGKHVYNIYYDDGR